MVRFQELAKQYVGQFPQAPLLLLDKDGSVLVGNTPCHSWCKSARNLSITLAAESLRWGDAAICECPHGYCLWAAPVTDNNELIGCIISGVSMPEDTSQIGQLTVAARELLSMACACNLTNEALLKHNAENTAREAAKAQAIHTLKNGMYPSVREMYLMEEAKLIAAIKTDERRQAREILNRILVGIYALSSRDFELLKAMVLELVIIIYRTAVEAGGDPIELLGLNNVSLQDFARINSEEELTTWLVSHLERLMDSIKIHSERPVEVQLHEALRYMYEHCTEPLTRDEVAKAAFMSPSHLSHSLRVKLNRSYVDLLNEMRINHARQLLKRSTRSLTQVALESGFSDHSYFTKVFRQYTGLTPSEYRRQRQDDN